MTETNKNLGFEILESNDSSVIYKRVLKRNKDKKEKFKIEMELPKLTIHLFDIEDLERLKKIEEELSRNYQQEESSTSRRNLFAFFD